MDDQRKEYVIQRVGLKHDMVESIVESSRDIMALAGFLERMVVVCRENRPDYVPLDRVLVTGGAKLRSRFPIEDDRYEDGERLLDEVVVSVDRLPSGPGEERIGIYVSSAEWILDRLAGLVRARSKFHTGNLCIDESGRNMPAIIISSGEYAPTNQMEGEMYFWGPSFGFRSYGPGCECRYTSDVIIAPASELFLIKAEPSARLVMPNDPMRQIRRSG